MADNRRFDIGERFLCKESSNFFGKKSWEKYFTSIDFEKGILGLYDAEDWKEKKKLKEEVNIMNCEFYDAVKLKQRPCTIKICPHVDTTNRKSNKKKGLYFSAEDLRSIDEFKIELEECAGTFEGIDRGGGGGGICTCKGSLFPASQTGLMRLETTDVGDWTKKDVLEWLRQLKVSKQIEKAFDENDVDGTVIEDVDEAVLLKLGIPQKDVGRMLMEVERLRKARRFNSQRSMVKMKIERFPGFDQQSEEFQDMIDYLCDAAKLKHKFLSTASLKDYAKKLGKSMNEDPIKMQYLEEAENDVFQEFRDNKIKIKLVVTEILHSKRAQNIRKIISPVLNTFGPKAIKTDFGFFHTAIIVGPWYLEWTDSELIIPKRMVSGKAIISADVDTIAVPTEGLKEISDKIAEVVVKWNTQFRYSNTTVGGKKLKEGGWQGNCQDFVDEILEALKVEINFDGALGQFVERMRSSGKCELAFSPGQKFRDHFGITEKSYVFDTHEDLDIFCCKIKEKCLEVFNMFSSEWGLLKSFDRAFWLRHLKFPTDPKFKPLPPKKQSYKEYDTGCVFGHPYATK